MKYWSGWNSITENKKRANPETNDTNNTTNDNINDDDDDHQNHNNTNTKCVRPSKIDSQEMASVGYMIKRIFDQGRIEFLKRLQYKARQIKYCDKKLTPECVIIIAEKETECRDR